MEFNFSESVIDECIIHLVGNKGLDETCTISKERVILDHDANENLKHYFLTPFKSEETFRFHHDIQLTMNEVYMCAGNVFDQPDTLVTQSESLARHLYNQSIHPKVKGGEFYAVYFRDCIFEGMMVDAIGLFKSEIKESFMEVQDAGSRFSIEIRQGIQMNKPDKGCLIFNIEKEDGYVVSLIDLTNRGSEAQYWKDDFLGVKAQNNEFYQTSQAMGITRQFVTQKLSEEFDVSKTEQIDLLNRSVEYFKSHEHFEQGDFESAVFADSEVIESYRHFDQAYRNEHQIEASDHFDISSQAVKKQAKVFKSVLKLDKNFHIYIHGNKDLIQQGMDEQGRKYYKIFYEQEL